jgi:hypothetical protein
MSIPENSMTTTTETSPAPTRTYGTVVVGTLLVVLGVLWLLNATGVLELRLAVVLPAALAAVGLALAVGSFTGPHPGLISFGVFLTIATLVVALAPVGFRGGIGERNVRVTQQTELETRYEVALGKIDLDMGDLALTRSAEVRVAVGAGEILIILPDDVAVRVETSVGAGEIDLLGEHADGLSPSLTHTSPGFDSASVTLTIDVSVGAGKIEVRR